MQAAAETLFIPGGSRLHRAHPFCKLSYILLAGTAAYLLPWEWYPGLGLLVFNALLLAGCRVSGPAWKVIWRTVLPIALFMLPIHGFLYPGNETLWIGYGGFFLYREGLMFALAVILKLTVVLQASLLFVFTTHPADLITAVSQSAGSPSLAYLIGSPLLLLPSMRGRIRTIQAAQQARGLETSGHMLKRFRGLLPLVAPLVLGSIIEIEQRSIALELRGFKSDRPKTALRQVPDSQGQRAARWLMLAMSAGILMFRGLNG